MSRPTVLVTDIAWPTPDVERGVLGAEVDVVVAPAGDEATLVRLAADADVVLTCWAQVSAAVLDAAPGLRAVVRYGVGVDNIDVAHATSRGIVVGNVPDFCVDEVSDQVLASVLTLSRRLPMYDARVRRGEWGEPDLAPMRRLRGQTLGLVGYGRIASEVARKARAFGLEVVVLTRTPRPVADLAAQGVTAATDLHDLLARSDFVSLHAPLGPETRHLIDVDALRAMKDTAVLVNTGRGGLVDEHALAAALRAGSIAAAALDVRVDEPPGPEDPLAGVPNLLLTPHTAFRSAESTHDLQTKAATSARLVLEGRLPVSVVNPDAVPAQGLPSLLRTAR